MAQGVQHNQNKRLSMKPVINRLMPIIIASLFISALGLCGGSEVFQRRAHHLAEIPTVHNVGFEAGRYYMTQGPWGNRTTISRRQHTLFRENKRRAAALSLPGGLLGGLRSDPAHAPREASTRQEAASGGRPWLRGSGLRSAVEAL